MDWFLNWEQVSELPPVHLFLGWFLGLGIWDWGPFGWLGHHAPFQDRLPLFFLTIVVIIGLITELIWWRVMVMRAKQINFNDRAATIWQTGPRKGQLKEKPVNLDRARARQISWPLLGVPFTAFAGAMWIFFLLYPEKASWQLFALLWFFTAPLRKVWGMWVARKAFRVTNPDSTITTTLWEDARDYYQTGIAGASRRKAPEPGFESNTWFGRRMNWVQVNIRPKSLLYFLGRLLTFRWLWGVIAQLVAPFWYMSQVEEYRDWMRPWWRWNRQSQTPNRVVKGEVIAERYERPGGNARSASATS
jgi:hypothetical protein